MESQCFCFGVSLEIWNFGCRNGRLRWQRSVAKLPAQPEVEAAEMWRNSADGYHAAWPFAALASPCPDDRILWTMSGVRFPSASWGLQPL